MNDITEQCFNCESSRCEPDVDYEAQSHTLIYYCIDALHSRRFNSDQDCPGFVADGDGVRH